MSNVLGTLSFLDTPDVNGVLVLTQNDAVTSVSGTANQITVTGSLPSYTASLADNPIIPGLQRLRLPIGATADRPTGAPGDIRFNTTLGYPEYYAGTSWQPPGRVLQMVTGAIAAVNTTAIIPLDNTVPTSTEGVQIFTTSFTPLSSTSRIVVSFSISVNTNTNNISVASCIFSGTVNQGATITRCATSTATTGVLYCLTNQATWAPGSTAAITISGRAGPLATSTCYINSHPTALFGGILVSEYTITEIA
jgi:hypothetical protein